MNTALALPARARMGESAHQFAGKQLKGPTTPTFWQTARFFRRPEQFLQECHQKYGDAFAVRWPGSRRHVLFAGPTAIRQILTSSEDLLCPTSEYATFLPFLSRRCAMRNVSPQRQEQKQALLRAFNNANCEAYVEKAAAKSRAMAAKFPVAEEFEVDGRVDEFAADLAVEIVLGESNSDTSTALKHNLNRGVGAYGPLLLACRAFRLPWACVGPWSVFEQTARNVHELAEPIVGDGRSRARDCIAAKYAVIAADGRFSRESIFGDLVMITMACYVAISTRTKLIIKALAENPRVQARLRDESPTRGVGNVFLDATFSELLRLYPNNPLVPRRAREDLTIDGFQVKAGDTVGVCTYLAHRRAETYTNPHEFRPERFIDRRYSPYEYLPFGGGTRKCPAANFAPKLLKAVTAGITSQCAFRLADRPANPQRMLGIHMGLSRPVAIVSGKAR